MGCGLLCARVGGYESGYGEGWVGDDVGWVDVSQGRVGEKVGWGMMWVGGGEAVGWWMWVRRSGGVCVGSYGGGGGAGFGIYTADRYSAMVTDSFIGAARQAENRLS